MFVYFFKFLSTCNMPDTCKLGMANIWLEVLRMRTTAISLAHVILFSSSNLPFAFLFLGNVLTSVQKIKFRGGISWRENFSHNTVTLSYKDSNQYIYRKDVQVPSLPPQSLMITVLPPISLSFPQLTAAKYIVCPFNKINYI